MGRAVGNGSGGPPVGGSGRKKGRLSLGPVAMRRFLEHQRKAEDMARRYAYRTYRQDEVEDLVQEARLALAKAAKLYKPGHRAGAKFWTFAHWYVEGSLEHYMRDKAWIIRSPKQVRGEDGEWKPFPAARRWECNPAPLGDGSDRLEDDGGIPVSELKVAIGGLMADMPIEEAEFVRRIMDGASPDDMGLSPEIAERLRRSVADRLRGILP